MVATMNIYCMQCGAKGHEEQDCKEVFKEGDRVMVFDHRLYKDDVTTPISMTVKPATVVKWYGKTKTVYRINDFEFGPYPSLVDVLFDHRQEEISEAHFTYALRRSL